MSDTPETDAAVIKSNGQWSFVLRDTCAKLERERDEARVIIFAFCEGSAWAADSWKSQPHIKPLFDFAKNEEETK